MLVLNGGVGFRYVEFASKSTQTLEVAGGERGFGRTKFCDASREKGAGGWGLGTVARDSGCGVVGHAILPGPE